MTAQGANRAPVWSPDGKRILFQGGVEGQMLSVVADGSGAIEPATKEKTDGVPASWSADGKWLAYLEQRDERRGQIWIRPMSGEGEPKPFLASSKFTYSQAAFSPDGRWLAYNSNESGTEEVYVQAFPGPGERRPISNGGGIGPMWNPNGRELFFSTRGAKPKMMALDIAPGASFKAGRPHVLFEGGWSLTTPLRSYDITSDGQHFIMVQPGDVPDQKVTRLNVVLNWFDELKKRAPRSVQ